MAERVGLVVLATQSDATSLSRLRASLDRFNADGLPVIIRDPDEVPAVLDLWRTTDLDVAVVIAAGVEFIRPFGLRDFVSPDGIAFTVVSEEAERRVEAVDPVADEAHRAVLREVGLADSRLLVSRGVAVVATSVLRSFSTDFLSTRGWDPARALTICPDEFAWYTAWLRASNTVAFEMHEPLVAALDTPGARSDAAMNGTTATDLARGYLGVLWPTQPTAFASASSTLAEGFRAGELASATLRRVTRKAPRVQRWLRLS